jgi:hypothetical protein
MAFMWLGWSVGRFYTHIQDAELICYLEEQEKAFKGSEKWNLLHAVEQIDSCNVRRFLRMITNRRGTQEDTVLRENDGLRISTLAYQDLMYRGDLAAVEYFVTEAISLDQRRAWAERDLVKLSRDDVAQSLRQALASADMDARRAAIIRLLGYFGGEEDVGVIRSFLDSGHDGLADAAYEAVCRLSDPLLVPSDWGGLS